MDASRNSNIAQFVGYQLCRTKTVSGDTDLVLNLFVGREMVSATTIGRLSADDAVQVLVRCIAHLERLGACPVEDAIAYDRAA